MEDVEMAEPTTMTTTTTTTTTTTNRQANDSVREEMFAARTFDVRVDRPGERRPDLCRDNNDDTAADTASDSRVSSIMRRHRTTTMTMNCEINRQRETLRDWRVFTVFINTLARLSSGNQNDCNGDGGDDETVTTSSPRLGDLAYAIGLVAVEVGRFDDNMYVSDFFSLSLRDFTERYMDLIIDRFGATERERMYSLKIWLNSRVHFDQELGDSVCKKRIDADVGGCGTNDNLAAVMIALGANERKVPLFPHKGKDKQNIDHVEESIENVTSKRLIFIDNDRVLNTKNNYRLLGVEGFSPTYSLFTIANLNDNGYRFDREPTNDTDSTIGCPPAKRNWVMIADGKKTGSNERSVGKWPIQQLMLCGAREQLNKDRLLVSFVDSVFNGRAPFINTDNNNNDHQRRPTTDTPATSAAKDDMTNRIMNSVKTFNKPEMYYEEYERDQEMLFGAMTMRARQTTFETMIKGLEISWAKLKTFVPQVFP